jgi:hypothetical protein
VVRDDVPMSEEEHLVEVLHVYGTGDSPTVGIPSRAGAETSERYSSQRAGAAGRARCAKTRRKRLKMVVRTCRARSLFARIELAAGFQPEATGALSCPSVQECSPEIAL